MNTGKTGIGRFFKGFVYAFEGVVSCIKTERNMRFHIGAAVLVILLMRFYGLSAAETAAVYIPPGFRAAQVVRSLQRYLATPDPRRGAGRRIHERKAMDT